MQVLSSGKRQSEKKLLPKLEPPVAVLTCIDARLIGALEKKLPLPPKTIFMIKTAGNIIWDEKGEIMFSLLVTTRVLQCKAILVIGHTDCALVSLLRETPKDKLEILSFSPQLAQSTRNITEPTEADITLFSARKIRSSSFISPEIPIHALIYNLHTETMNYIQTF